MKKSSFTCLCLFLFIAYSSATNLTIEGDEVFSGVYERAVLPASTAGIPFPEYEKREDGGSYIIRAKSLYFGIKDLAGEMKTYKDETRCDWELRWVPDPSNEDDTAKEGMSVSFQRKERFYKGELLVANRNSPWLFHPPTTGWKGKEGGKSNVQMHYSPRIHPCDIIAFEMYSCKTRLCQKKKNEEIETCVQTHWQKGSHPPGQPPRHVPEGEEVEKSDVKSLLNCAYEHVFKYQGAARWCQCTNCSVRGNSKSFVSSKEDKNPHHTKFTVEIYSPISSSIKKDTNYQLVTPIATATGQGFPDSHWVEDAQIQGEVVNFPLDWKNCSLVVQKPSVVFAVRWMHNLFHLLVDVMLPLYHTMSLRGSSSLNLWIYHVSPNVSGSQGNVEKLLVDTASLDKPLRLLRFFTANDNSLSSKIHSWDEFSKESRTCFKDVQFGLNVAHKNNWVTAAMHKQGALLAQMDSDELSRASSLLQLQNKFNNFLLEKLDLRKDNESRSDTIHLTFIKRKRPRVEGREGSRKLLNREALLATVHVYGQKSKIEVVDVALEDLSFQEQLAIFRKTDIFVAVHGAANANVNFLTRGKAVLLLLMEPGNFGNRWIYGNMASLSGIDVVIPRLTSATTSYEGFNGIGTHQNAAKEIDFEYPVTLFSDALERSIDLVMEKRSNNDASKVEWGQIYEVKEQGGKDEL